MIAAHVVMTGYFESINCDEAQRNAFLCHNAPAILFPYMRAYVSCVTAQSGMSPVIIPTINLRKEGENLLAQISKASED
ncbi:MAG: protein-export chaperone SecB [Muribaculaceae bacterium]